MADAARALTAMGDPTRRAVLEVLRGGDRSVGEIAASLPVSQPAVSQHLRVLREAGLVTSRQEGTRHLYRVAPDGLGPLRAYLDSFWDTALSAFAELADAESAETVTHPRPSTEDR